MSVARATGMIAAVLAVGVVLLYNNAFGKRLAGLMDPAHTVTVCVLLLVIVAIAFWLVGKLKKGKSA